MAVKIRCKRFGKKHAPYYRVVVLDSRTRRDGRAIEEIGKYHPMEEPSLIEIDSTRVKYWLGVGAQPSDQVVALLKLTGDWQAFKGDKGAVNTVKPPQPKPSAEERIREAAKAAERQKAAKAVEKKKAAQAAAKAAAEEKATEKKPAEEKPVKEKQADEAERVEAETVADESREVPDDEGTEVDIEIAEGDPSDIDKVEGIIDEAKAEG